VDTHPDSTATTDLRLLSPWPELSSFALELTQNITALDAHTHGHIPYVALLLHFLEQWGDEHDGNSPTAYTDKVAFRKTVAAAARTDNPEGGEENFEEAVAAVLKTIIAPSLSSSVREVFDYTPTEEEAKSPFWIITSAIKKFYEAHGELPLPGAMPDMKAQSQVYVQLQNIYKTKAREDAAEVKRYVDAHPHGSGVDPQEIETYCKNAAFVKLVRATTEVNLKAIAEAELNQEFAIAPTLVPVYLALRASENIAELNQENLVQEMSRIIGAEVTDERLIHTAKEVVRAQKGELHNIAALTGGMVAQEIIKIITKQYIPVDNTCIFDGITSRCQVLKL
jgi:amyloid beta precursor protein binding protein 1